MWAPTTTDAAVSPTFSLRQPPLVTWHFFLLALQASVPTSVDDRLLQRPQNVVCSLNHHRVRRYRSPSLLIPFCGSLSPEFLRPGRNPENNLPRDSSEIAGGLLSLGHRSARFAFLHPSLRGECLSNTFCHLFCFAHDQKDDRRSTCAGAATRQRFYFPPGA